MAKEIECKYLVVDDSFKKSSTKKLHIVQGYLSTDPEATIRVRICDSNAFITIKGINKGAVRDEWEYPIPIDDAKEIMKCCKNRLIDKIRYIVPYKGKIWEIDEFHGKHHGLILAEIELDDENETVAIPPFVGKDVTGDAAYYNSVLAGI